MYKVLHAILPALVVLALAGCSKKETPAKVVECTFNAGIDLTVDGGEVTKALLTDGGKVDSCVMEIFYQGTSCTRVSAPVESSKATVHATVVSGRTYDIMFWACNSKKWDDKSLRAVSVNDNMTRFDTDSLDAFCARLTDVTIGQSPAAQAVELKRALSMVTVTFSNAPAAAADSVLIYTAPTRIDLFTDELSNQKQFFWQYSGQFFILAPATKTNMDIKIGGKTITAVPIQRNYKTNITIAED